MAIKHHLLHRALHRLKLGRITRRDRKMSADSIRKALVITVVMATMIPHLSRASDAPLEVSMISSPGSGFPGVTIANTADDIVVTNVIFNRKNCGLTVPYGVRWPAKLKFGEAVNLYGTTPAISSRSMFPQTRATGRSSGSD